MPHAVRKAEAEFNAQTPRCLSWDITQVEEWITSIGFPMYTDCFRANFVNGRKLVTIDASHLPKIGVCDFDHIKKITKSIRELLEKEEPDYNRGISFPHTDPLGLFVDAKSRTGKRADDLTYSKFVKRNQGNLKRWFGNDAPSVPKV